MSEPALNCLLGMNVNKEMTQKTLNIELVHDEFGSVNFNTRIYITRFGSDLVG